MKFIEIFFEELSSYLNENISYKPSKNKDFEGFEFLLSNDFKIVFDKNFVFEILKIFSKDKIFEISKKEIFEFKIIVNKILDKVSNYTNFIDFKGIKNILFIKSEGDLEHFELTFKNKTFNFALSLDGFRFDTIKDVEIELKFKIASSYLSLNEIFNLNSGDLIDLKTDEIVEIMLNDKVIAEGEFIELENDKLGVKIINLKE